MCPRTYLLNISLTFWEIQLSTLWSTRNDCCTVSEIISVHTAEIKYHIIRNRKQICYLVVPRLVAENTMNYFYFHFVLKDTKWWARETWQLSTEHRQSASVSACPGVNTENGVFTLEGVFNTFSVTYISIYMSWRGKRPLTLKAKMSSAYYKDWSQGETACLALSKGKGYTVLIRDSKRCWYAG